MWLPGDWNFLCATPQFPHLSTAVYYINLNLLSIHPQNNVTTVQHGVLWIVCIAHLLKALHILWGTIC